MRLVLAALLFVIATQIDAAEEEQNYFYAVSFSDGFAMTRYAKPEYADTLRNGRPDCVVISWAYAPTGEDNADELKLERGRASDAVAAELDDKRGTVPALVTLSGFTGVWIIYTSAGQELAQGLERRLRNLSRSKFSVRLVSDSDWTVYTNYVKKLREKK
jgi:hypothetical protein